MPQASAPRACGLLPLNVAMALHLSPIVVTARAPLAERRNVIRRESLRDFAGVAVGVAASALLWVVSLSLIRP